MGIIQWFHRVSMQDLMFQIVTLFCCNTDFVLVNCNQHKNSSADAQFWGYAAGGLMMIDVRIEKTKILDLPMSYAISILHRENGDLCVCASEGLGGCYVFPLKTLAPVYTVWENAGGCMSIVQTEEDGTFLAVQNFFKGFNAKQGRLVKATPSGDNKWTIEQFLDMPYLHRFDVIDIDDRKFLIACTLCKNKEFREDWSEPGTVYLGELKSGTMPPEIMDQIIPSLTKNHGFYRGIHHGKDVLLISGMEGLFEVTIPRCADAPWLHEKLIDREISDAAIVDIDNDGIEEIITIEGFHGDHIAINKLVDKQWTEVYRYPAPFAHIVWGGVILGRQSLLLAYRNDNGALILLRKSKRDSAYYMDNLVIDELVSPTNLVVDSQADHCHIFCSCGKTQQVVRYTLTNK